MLLRRLFFHLLFAQDLQGAVVQGADGTRWFVDGTSVSWLARVRGEEGSCASGATLERPWWKERPLVSVPVWRPAYDVRGGRLVCAPDPGAPTVAIELQGSALTLVITAGEAPLELQRLGWAYLVPTALGPVAESDTLGGAESAATWLFADRAGPTWLGPSPRRVVEERLRLPLRVPPAASPGPDIELIVWAVDREGLVVVSEPAVLVGGVGYGGAEGEH